MDGTLACVGPLRRRPEAILSVNTDVTRILKAIDEGDASASASLLPLVYEELRRLADRRLAGERPGHTLQATALVHEAYMRLVGSDQTWDGRGHFFAAAAEAMRRVIIDRARAKGALKRGGGLRRLTLEGVTLGDDGVLAEVLDLDDALTRLAQEAPDKAELVKLRFFAGLTLSQAAEALGISQSTADRHWAYARAWLYSELSQNPDNP